MEQQFTPSDMKLPEIYASKNVPGLEIFLNDDCTGRIEYNGKKIGEMNAEDKYMVLMNKGTVYLPNDKGSLDVTVKNAMSLCEEYVPTYIDNPKIKEANSKLIDEIKEMRYVDHSINRSGGEITAAVKRLTLSNDGYREAYRRAGLYTSTGRTLDDILKSNDYIMVEVYSNFNKDYAEAAVKLFEKPYGEKYHKMSIEQPILLSPEEQLALNEIAKYKVPTEEFKEQKPSETLLRKHKKNCLCDIFLTGCDGIGISEDGESMKVQVYSPLSGREAIARRSVCSEILREKTSLFGGARNDHREEVVTEVTLTKNDLKLTLSDRHLGETVNIPLTKNEKDDIHELVQGRCKKLYAEFMNNANGNKNVKDKAERRSSVDR